MFCYTRTKIPARIWLKIRELALNKGYSASKIIEELKIGNLGYSPRMLKRGISYMATGFNSKIETVNSYQGMLSPSERKIWRQKVNQSSVIKKEASLAGIRARGREPWNKKDDYLLHTIINFPAFNHNGIYNCLFLSSTLSSLTGVPRSSRAIGNRIGKLKKNLEKKIYKTTAKQSAEVFTSNKEDFEPLKFMPIYQPLKNIIRY